MQIVLKVVTQAQRPRTHLFRGTQTRTLCRYKKLTKPLVVVLLARLRQWRRVCNFQWNEWVRDQRRAQKGNNLKSFPQMKRHKFRPQNQTGSPHKKFVYHRQAVKPIISQNTGIYSPQLMMITMLEELDGRSLRKPVGQLTSVVCRSTTTAKTLEIQ